MIFYSMMTRYILSLLQSQKQKEDSKYFQYHWQNINEASKFWIETYV